MIRTAYEDFTSKKIVALVVLNTKMDVMQEDLMSTSRSDHILDQEIVARRDQH